MLDNLPYVKYYESKEYLQDELANGKSAREIANENNVSYKLINQWLLNHGLITRSEELRLP
jgi:hypothetical protein